MRSEHAQSLMTSLSVRHVGHECRVNGSEMYHRQFQHWNREFDSHSKHRCMSFLCVCVVLCKQMPSVGLIPVQGALSTVFKIHGKKPPWPESASELYRPSDRLLSEKLMPTFADRGCLVVRAMDPYCRILDF
jgi:hypothetical protein